MATSGHANTNRAVHSISIVRHGEGMRAAQRARSPSTGSRAQFNIQRVEYRALLCVSRGDLNCFPRLSSLTSLRQRP